MKALSLFSGIGGFDLAMERVGIDVVGMCEIDKHAQEVLKKHFPNATLHDDVKKVGKEQYERKSIDVIVGGFPCQDLSIAGKRAGLAGERSGLWHEFARIIDELEPNWVVVENVPGLLSSNKGADLAVILQWLAQRGYGVCWRILDAQYFGVPQRRRRVFIIASFGNGRCAEVLFEQEGMRRNPAESRKTGQAASGTFTVRSGKDGGGKGYLGQESLAMTLGGQPQWAYSISSYESNVMKSPNPNTGIQEIDSIRTLDNNGSNPACNQGGTIVIALAENTIGRKPENGGNGNDFTEGGPMYTLNATGVHGVAHTLRANAKQSLMSGDGVINETLVFTPGNLMRGAGPNPSDIVPTLGANTQGDQFPHIIAQNVANTLAGGTMIVSNGQANAEILEECSPTLNCNHEQPILWQNRQQSGEVRLQDDTVPTMTKSWGTGGNNVPFVGVRRLTPVECERLQGFPDNWTFGSDTQRYKQLGNAVAVPVVEWIMKRITIAK